MPSKHLVARGGVTGATMDCVPLLDIPAASGELKSFGVSDGIGSQSFRKTIDGTVLADAALSGTASGSAISNTGLAVALRFEQSLLVEVSGSVRSPQTTYRTVVSTDSSEFSNRTSVVRPIGDAQYRFETLTYRRAGGTVYDVTTAIVPDKISRISCTCRRVSSEVRRYQRGSCVFLNCDDGRGWRRGGAVDERRGCGLGRPHTRGVG